MFTRLGLQNIHSILAVGSGQWAVGSGQWAVGSGQWAVGSGQWAKDSRLLATLRVIHQELMCERRPRGNPAPVIPSKPALLVGDLVRVFNNEGRINFMLSPLDLVPCGNLA